MKRTSRSGVLLPLLALSLFVASVAKPAVGQGERRPVCRDVRTEHWPRRWDGADLRYRRGRGGSECRIRRGGPRWALEVRQWGPNMACSFRRPARLRYRLGRDQPGLPQRGVGRDRGGERHRGFGRGRLVPVARWRRHVGPWGAGRTRGCPSYSVAPREPGHRICRRLGFEVGRRRGPRGLQDHRWRADMDPRAVRGRKDRSLGSDHGPERPRSPARGHVVQPKVSVDG